MTRSGMARSARASFEIVAQGLIPTPAHFVNLGCGKAETLGRYPPPGRDRMDAASFGLDFGIRGLRVDVGIAAASIIGNLYQHLLQRGGVAPGKGASPPAGSGLAGAHLLMAADGEASMEWRQRNRHYVIT
ncbi:MAG: hypothetical protein QOF96_3477 [Actinomycetota bacterium]|jgi:hypothetical protein|nr:hypothetical protein [Actinomycetota bacterium]